MSNDLTQGNGIRVEESDVKITDVKTKLDEFKSQATIQYSKKKYDEAAELFAHATELQARINGEMSPRNADLLYLYGRCLYQVAVRKSDVLGSKVAGEKPEEPTPSRNPTEGSAEEAKPREMIVSPPTSSNAPPPRSERSEEEKAPDSKPYFQFTGAENFDASDEEDGNLDRTADVEEGEAEEDDFANAFEVLDMARILIIQSIEEIEAQPERSASLQHTSGLSLRQFQERLADTYDLQAEISLEAEHFEAAVLDLRSALELKTSLYPFESNLLAEAHYKLSLGLEFASVTPPRDATGEIAEGKAPTVDAEKRADAVKEMEAAIASCKARISLEERKQSLTSADATELASKDALKAVTEVKEMVIEMEQRLAELRRPPASINDTSVDDDLAPLTGVMRSLAQGSTEQKQVTLEKAIEAATDLTALVKKRKLAPEDNNQQDAGTAVEQNCKRKHDDESGQSDKRPKI